MRRSNLILTLLIASAWPLRAQAPIITPAGDPSVQNDTIYKLVVDPADHPEESWVYLLDDGVVRLEADGRYTETFRQVVQITRDDGVNQFQEHRFGYEPGHQTLTINWIRVLDLDGTVISAKPSQMQESDVPAEMGDPVYSDAHRIRASLSGVKKGVLVDYSYTLHEQKPYRPGDFYGGWTVTTGLTTRRSRYVVDVPAAMSLSIVERNLNFRRTERVAQGRHVYTWAARDIPQVKGEPFAADSNGVMMSVAVAPRDTWNGVGAWFAKLAHDRYTLTPSAAARVHGVVASARTLGDSVRAVHRWVTQDIRYVSIDFGIGGYRPRIADSVIATGFGDCKDKAMLFVAALHSLGVTAYPVLLSAGGGVVRALPSKNQFDHLIAAVKGPADYTYSDLTDNFRPYGEIPTGDQGNFGVIVHPDGTTEEVTLPQDPPSANYVADTLVGSLSATGAFHGVFTEFTGGSRSADLRSAFNTPLDSTQRANITRALAARLFTGASGDSLSTLDGKDFAATPKLRLFVNDDDALTHSGATDLLTLPYTPPTDMANLANALAAQPPRKFTINAQAVVGPISATSVFRVTLPEGWRVEVPRDVDAASPFGNYSAHYAQNGREFDVTRTLSGARGILAPDRIGDLIIWARAVAKDDARFVLIQHAGSGTSN
jgi:transglutaminase-like putative cysteine protease